MPRLLVVSFAVCPAPDRHGVQLLNLLKAIAPRHEVDVLTLRVGDLPYVDRVMRARMLRVPVGPAGLREQAEAFRRALIRQLEGEEYDLIHVRSAWGARAVAEHAPPGTRVIYEVARSTEGEPEAADVAAQRALAEEEAVCLERADLVMVASEAARRHLAGRGLGERAVVVPPGVDVDHFDWEPRLEGEPAWLAGVAATRREPPADLAARVLYAGRVGAGRGVRLLLRALALLDRERPGAIRLLLAGPVEPDFRETLDRAIDKAGVGAVVDRLGAIDHEAMPRVIAQATVCVSPSAPDPETRPLAGCPIKLLEYMACKRAVVAPRRPAITEAIRDGREGLLFAPGDAADLARQITSLVDDADLRKAMAASGYRTVRARFPAAAARRRILEAYARLSSPTRWSAPARAPDPIGELPERLDSTTAFHDYTLPDLSLVGGEELEESDLMDVEIERDTSSRRTPSA